MKEQAESRSGGNRVGRFFGWFFEGNGSRLTLVALGVPVLFIALFYAEEDWRGSRAWRRVRQQVEARGVSLDWATYIPKPVPDDQNFASTPFVQSWFPRGSSWDDEYSKAATLMPDTDARRNGAEGLRLMTDLVSWSKAFGPTSEDEQPRKKKRHKIEPSALDTESRAKAALGVLAGLKDIDPDLTELAEASHRPYSRYPVVYMMNNPWAILLPHLARVKGVCVRLQLRASAELAAGDSGKALEDIKQMLFMTESIKDEPFLISDLVRMACMQISIQSIWEGLADRRWNDAQLQELEARLAMVDFIKKMKVDQESERAASILTVDLVKKQGLQLLESLSDGGGGQMPSPAAAALGFLVPSGWYNFEKANYCIYFDRGSVGALDVAARRISPKASEAAARSVQQALGGSALDRVLHHRIAVSMMLPSLQKTLLKTAMGQVAVDEAAIACAIERFRLARGRPPESLAELSPAFIPAMPKDPITGEFYKYRKTDDAGFILYSVGWDEKDDGGEPGRTLFDEKHGDWVWQYPAKQ